MMGWDFPIHRSIIVIDFVKLEIEIGSTATADLNCYGDLLLPISYKRFY